MLFVDRLRWRGKCGIGERANGNRDPFRHTAGLPEHRGAAVRTEMKCHRESTVGAPRKLFRRAVSIDILAIKERRDSIVTAGPLLAFKTMTQ